MLQIGGIYLQFKSLIKSDLHDGNKLGGTQLHSLSVMFEVM